MLLAILSFGGIGGQGLNFIHSHREIVGAQLVGIIPISIGQLSGLTYLCVLVNSPLHDSHFESFFKRSLSHNRLAGTIPASIILLTQLIYMYVVGNVSRA